MATESPTATAISSHLGTVSYGVLNRRIGGIARQLASSVDVGDFVAVDGLAPLDWIIVVMALHRLRAIAVILPSYISPDGVGQWVMNIGVKTIITTRKLVLDIRIINKSSLDWLLMAEWENQISLDQWAVVLPTSGSTAESKWVVLTIGNLVASAGGGDRQFGLRPGIEWGLATPLHHTSGLVVIWRCIVTGAAIRLDCGVSDILSCSVYPVWVSLVPTQLWRFLNQNSPGISTNILGVLLGGAAASQAMMELANGLGLRCYPTYGLTETAGQIATSPLPNPLNLNCGTALPGRQLRINLDGRIEVRGETLFRGYWDGEVATLPLTIDRWFVTADLGQWDGNGNLVPVGRADRVMIVGGENIRADYIEAVIRDIPGVMNVRVLGIPDREYGEVPVVVIWTIDANIPGIQDIARSRLTRLEFPRKWIANPPIGVDTKPRLADLRRLFLS